MPLSEKPDLMRWLRLLVLGTLAVAVLVLVVASWRLLFDYLPRPLGDPRLEDGYRAATRTLIAVGTVLVVLRATIWRQAGRLGNVPIVLAVGGTILIGVSTFTIGRVLWEQVPPLSIGVGADVAGLLDAAFRDDIRRVVVNDHEMSSGSYAWRLVLHGFLLLVGTLGIAIAALWPVESIPRRERPWRRVAR